MNDEILLDLYKQQAKIIYLYLLKHGCPREDAEDIVHESFVKAIQYMDGIANDKLPSWLFTVSINQYKNWLKRKSIVQHIQIDERFWENLSDTGEVETIVLKKEKLDQTIHCLQQLKEINRELLLMKYEMDLSYQEIGTMLGMKEEQVKTYLYRARNEFKKKWREFHE